MDKCQQKLAVLQTTVHTGRSPPNYSLQTAARTQGSSPAETTNWFPTGGSIYTVSQKKLGHFFTVYNFRNIEQIFTKFGTNQSLFFLNIVPEFI